MVVLDTCALIEATKLEPSFSSKALKSIEEGAIILSISFAEIACKVKLGKLSLSISVSDLFQRFSEIETNKIIDIGVKEWLDSIELDWKDNKDPADRMITAFAKRYHYPVVTTDSKIQQFYSHTLW